MKATRKTATKAIRAPKATKKGSSRNGLSKGAAQGTGKGVGVIYAPAFKAGRTRATAIKVSASKVGASKVTASKVRVSKVGASKVSASKLGVSKVSASKLGASKASASKLGVSKVGASKVSASKARASKVSASKLGVSKASASKLGVSKARASKVSASKVGVSKKSASRVSASKVVVSMANAAMRRKAAGSAVASKVIKNGPKRNGIRNGAGNGVGVIHEPVAKTSAPKSTTARRVKAGGGAANYELHDMRGTITALHRSQAVIEFSMDGTILTANDNFLRTVGYSLAEIQGKNHEIFCEPADSESVEYKKFWQALNRGEFQPGEFKRLGKGGKEVWIIASYNPVIGDDGKPVKVVKFATDITASKAELKARTDIMNLTSIVSESDLRGDILCINEKFCEVSKYSRQELLGKPHNTTRHPDMPKEVFKEMWATIGRGNMFRGIIKNRAKDGTPYYVDAVIAPIMGENGKPKKYLGVRYDITEAESERQNMRGIFRAIDSAYAYIEFDTEGNVLVANQNFQSTMEYSLDSIKGKHHRMFCDQATVHSVEYDQFWPDLRAGKTKAGEFKRVTRSGRELWLQAIYSPVTDETGRVVKVIKIATDVTANVRQRLSLVQVLKEVSDNAQTLSSASEELSANSQQMVANAEETAAQAGVVSAAAQQVSTNVQTVAAGTEEMSASIREIAKNAQEAAKVAAVGVNAADSASETISKLGISSAEIGKVIKTITSIAQQTNLLALNATIEAARAGEAGKGFAVVANEVKELAKETAKATEDISQKIEKIQSDTNHAVAAISEINGVINKISEFQETIASAVEEQTATTNEITRNIVEAAQGSTEIAQNILGVAEAARNTTLGASDTEKAAIELARMAASLQSTVASIKD